MGYSYPNASKYKVGNFTLEEEIDQLEINWIAGSVRVEVTEGTQVYAEETKVSDDDRKMRYLVENGKLTIQYQKSKFFSFGNWSKSKDLTVYKRFGCKNAGYGKRTWRYKGTQHTDRFVKCRGSQWKCSYGRRI